MEINFNKEYLRDLYKLGQADKKHRFQPQIVKKYIRIIDLMRDEDNMLGLTKYKKNISKRANPLLLYAI